MERNIPLVAAVLQSALSSSLGTVQLSKKLRIGPARTASLVNQLRAEGLIVVAPRRAQRAGRPTSDVIPTELGLEFLLAYRILESKRLKSSPADLKRAVADGEYARRLTERKAPIYDLFFELSGLGSVLREPPR